MAATESRMLALGTKAPAFSLPDPYGQMYHIGEDSDATLVMFICNHCPFVKHVREELARLDADYGERNIGIYAINSNDSATYAGDSPENMKKEADEWGYSFPYLIDADQSVAKAYRAACTPDFFVFDAQQSLVYRGQLDASRPSNDVPTDGCDVRAAFDAILNGEPVSTDQAPSIGCSIKWLPGNEPKHY